MDVRLPDGTIIKNVPDGTSKADLMAKLTANGYKSSEKIEPIDQPELTPRSYTTGEALTSAATNLIPSTGKLAVNVGKAIIQPANTLEGLIQLGSGVLSKALPESIMKYAVPEKRQQAEAVANAIGQEYKGKYGSAEGFKRAIAEDPANVLADVSTVLTGGGAALKGAQLGSNTAKVADIVNTTAKYTNPLYLGGKAIQGASYIPGQFLKGTLGVTTGVGKTPVEEAITAGTKNVLTGDETFIKNIRNPSEGNAVEIAKQAVDNLRQQKNQAYRGGMVDISKDKNILNFKDIDLSIINTEKMGMYKGKVVNEKAFDAIGKAKQAINEWKNADPVEFHTPEGMDKLKQKVGGILETIPYDQSTPRAAVQNIYNSIKTTINNQAPTYAKVMKDYSKSSELITEIEKGLSLGKKATADAGMRKLQSIMRNNVTTNYGQRANLANKLVEAGGENLMPALAGQSMSAILPRGLGGQIETYGGGAAAIMNPSLIPLAPFFSPRAMGETLYKYGQIKGLAKKGASKLPLSVDQTNQLGTLLYQLNQAKEQQGLLGQ